jgi:hypothetical protein
MLERWQKKLTFPATWATDGSKRRFFGFSIEQHAVDPSGNKSRGLEASLEAQSGPPTTARPGWLLVAFWTRLGESMGGKTVEHWSRVVLEVWPTLTRSHLSVSYASSAGEDLCGWAK